MLKSNKKRFVANLEDAYKKSSSVIITHYHGLSVSDITALRRNLREKGASFKVVKNTLSNIAASRTGLNYDSKMFSGPTAIAYSEDPVSSAKGVVEFAKTNDNLKIIGGLVNDTILDEKAVRQLAKLPSLDELRGKLIGLLNAPASNIIGVLESPGSSIARVLQAYSDK